MVEYVIIAILVIITAVLLLIRSNVAVGFLALCAGKILVASSGENMGLIASSLTSGMSSASNYIKLVILFLPLVLVSLFTRGKAKSYLFIINLVSAASISGMSLIFAYPLLPDVVSSQFNGIEVWSNLAQYEELIMGVGVVSSVLIIILSSKRSKEKGRKKH